MTAEAVVVQARDNGAVDLEFDSVPSCASCAGTCLWKRLQSMRLEQIAAGSGLAPGTRVTVTLPERRVLATSILLHGLPLLAILAGAATGAALTGTDAGTLAGALLALAAAVPSFRPLGRRLEQKTLRHLMIRPRA